MLELVTAEEVRARLSLPDDDGVIAGIESALLGVTTFLEAKLRTNFEAGDKVDWFVLTSATLHRNGLYKLRLSNGFLLDYTLASTSSLGSSSLDPITPVGEDREKGIVSIFYDGGEFPTYIKVDYSYGFEDPEEVPSWLKELAVSYTIKMLSMQQISDGKPEISKMSAFLDSHRVEILDTHLRKDPFANGPII